MAGVAWFIKGTIYVVSKFMIPVLSIVAVLLVIATILTWMASAATVAVGSPFLDILYGSDRVMSFAFMAVVLILITIPALALVLFLLRLFFGKRVGSKVHLALWSFWGLGIAGTFILGTFTAKEFSEETNYSLSAKSYPIKNDTITLSMYEPKIYDVMKIETDFLHASSKGTWLRRINVNFHPSAGTNEITIRPELSGRGPNPNEAKKYLNAIEWTTEFDGENLQIPAFYSLPEETPWRNQLLTLNVSIPHDIYVHFDEDDDLSTTTLEEAYSKKVPFKVISRYPDFQKVNYISSEEIKRMDVGETWKSEVMEQ